MNLSDSEKKRYSRQILLKEIGSQGQIKLKSARVLVVGVGGLGCPSALYLAAAGVGTIGLVDDDFIEWSNLHRQVLFGDEQMGLSKAESARARLKSLNSTVNVVAYSQAFSIENAQALCSQFDVIVDCSDNFNTRYLVNDTCVSLGKPFVQASVQGFHGCISTIVPGFSACYRCSYPQTESMNSIPNCATAGVLGSVAGVLGTLQATEVLQLILRGLPVIETQGLCGQMLTFNALDMEFQTFQTTRDPQCLACGSNLKAAASLNAAGPKVTDSSFIHSIHFSELNDWKNQHPMGVVVDLRSDHERSIFGCLAGSLHFTYEKTITSQWSNFFYDQIIETKSDCNALLFFCASGARARAMAKQIQSICWSQFPKECVYFVDDRFENAALYL